MILSLRLVAVALFASACAPIASAQTAPADSAPSERAQRDADKVRQMILMHADRPRKARTEERPAASIAATARAAPAGDVAATEAPRLAARVTEPGPLATQAAVPDLAPTPTVAVAPLPAMLPVATLAARKKLELISGAEPAFPRRLVGSAANGSVRVAFDVLPDGSVTAVHVLRSPHPGLNAAAVAAVAQWRFQPVAERMSGATEFTFDP